MTPKDNDDLTRIGPGTVMGEFMRQCWIPAALSGEVEADGRPLRLLLLGEKLIAFRDSQGRVGVMDHRCPHRAASLFLGRNEEGGIRCVYHGWKFDVTGRCVEMPSVPGELDFKEKVTAKAYRAVDRAGLIWVYMGKQVEPPPLPDFEALNLPSSQVRITISLREHNWLQGLEGDIDTSHLGFVHAGHLEPEDLGETHPMYHAVVDRAPKYRVIDSELGTTYATYRPVGPGRLSWRIGHYIFPFWSQTPNTEFTKRVVANAWVPMDDTHTMMIKISGGAGDVVNFAYVPASDGKPLEGFGDSPAHSPNTADWYGRFRPVANPGNDWLIDRQVQKTRTFSGIETLFTQDQALTESMGPIVDRTFEHLGPSDVMVARTRRRLLSAARAHAATGELPDALYQAQLYLHSRSGTFYAEENADWQEMCAQQLKQSVRWLTTASKGEVRP